jgi:hypothetical protein
VQTDLYDRIITDIDPKCGDIWKNNPSVIPVQQCYYWFCGDPRWIRCNAMYPTRLYYEHDRHDNKFVNPVLAKCDEFPTNNDRQFSHIVQNILWFRISPKILSRFLSYVIKYKPL